MTGKRLRNTTVRVRVLENGNTSCSWTAFPRELTQLRELGFRLLQDGDAGVSVFPKREEIVVGGESTGAGGISLGPLRSCRFERMGPGQAQMRQRPRPTVPDQAAVIENLLELCGGFLAPSRCQIGIAANVGGIETRGIDNK